MAATAMTTNFLAMPSLTKRIHRVEAIPSPPPKPNNQSVSALPSAMAESGRDALRAEYMNHSGNVCMCFCGARRLPPPRSCTAGDVNEKEAGAGQRISKVTAPGSKESGGEKFPKETPAGKTEDRAPNAVQIQGMMGTSSLDDALHAAAKGQHLADSRICPSGRCKRFRRFSAYVARSKNADHFARPLVRREGRTQ